MTVKNEINSLLDDIEAYLLEIINENVATQANWSDPKLIVYDIDENENFLGIYSVQTSNGEIRVRFITDGKNLTQGIEV